MDPKDSNTPEDFLSSARSDATNNTKLGKDHKKLVAGITELLTVSGNERLSPQKKQILWGKILSGLPVEKPLTYKIAPVYRRLYAAAAVLLFFITGMYFINFHKEKSQLLTHQTTHLATNDILPGSNKAVLTLANGTTVDLNDAKKGLLSKQGKTLVNKTAGGQITYHQNEKIVEAGITNFNTITTPRGGQFQIILPDGTKAWLNAASSLKFPVAFTGTERNVELTGEAYFEVAKNKSKPFKVNVNGAKVEVLGTHFNIMAYDDEDEVTATLLEGSVKFSKNGNPILLKPGQQGLLNNATGKIKVQPADIDAVIAWQKGYYLFKEQNIKGIMRSLSRWYNIDVVYKGDFEDKDFSGKISRFKNISEVLRLLELTDDVHFKMEGRRLTVMP